jgi:serine/threonine-protein kinase
MIIGQYRIIEKIGQGGMGVIYKAEHTTLEQIVAIKALPSTFGSNSDICERFIREAKIQAKLSHPNVVNILNFLEHEGNNYIVMEYVDGETLEAIIRTTGLIPPDRCIAILRQVLDGIGYAHSQGVIHRDIKPSNIMITRQGIVKITDFGIAKIAGDLKHTQTGVKVGTLWYMSPEQVQGQQAGVTSDIYALGITLFEMVTGKVPFTGDSEYHIMHNIVQNPPPDPREYYPYIPVSLEKTILKAIAKSPRDRFQNVREFAESLEREEVGIATTAAPREDPPLTGPVRSAPYSPPKSRKMLWAILGAASAVAVAAGAAFFLWGSGTKAMTKREIPAAPLPAPVAATGGAGQGTAKARIVQQEPERQTELPGRQEPERLDETTDKEDVPKIGDGKNLRSGRKGKRLASKDSYPPERTRRYRESGYRESGHRHSGHAAEMNRTMDEARRMTEKARSIMPDGSFTKGLSPE